jgi:hypothetical protein
MRASIWLLLVACAPRLYSEDSTLDTPEPGGEWVAPDNGWPMAAPPAGLVGVGFSDGQVVPDVRGLDQAGDEVSLWQFHGLYVLIDISTMWCSPCQELGMHTEATYQEFKDRGFVYLTVLHEDVENGDVSEAELNQWAGLPALDREGAFDTITAPIIHDPKGANGSASAIEGNQYPAAILVGPDLRVIDRVEPVTSDRVDQVLDEVLPAADGG